MAAGGPRISSSFSFIHRSGRSLFLARHPIVLPNLCPSPRRFHRPDRRRDPDVPKASSFVRFHTLTRSRMASSRSARAVMLAASPRYRPKHQIRYQGLDGHWFAIRDPAASHAEATSGRRRVDIDESDPDRRTLLVWYAEVARRSLCAADSTDRVWREGRCLTRAVVAVRHTAPSPQRFNVGCWTDHGSFSSETALPDHEPSRVHGQASCYARRNGGRGWAMALASSLSWSVSVLRSARRLRPSTDPEEYLGRRFPCVRVQEVPECLVGTLERCSILFR